MIEIRFHGRGGQGTVTAAHVFAQAAFLEGKYSQSFPYFGTERRGAPVTAFCRIGEEKITIHSSIYEPDCVVVLDVSLIRTADVTSGLKKDGWLIINTKQKPENFKHLGFSRVVTVDATLIAAAKKLGSEKSPIVNTTILGAVAKATNLVKLESLLEAIKKEIEQKTAENMSACGEAYENVQIFLVKEMEFPSGNSISKQQKEGENDDTENQ